MKAEIITIGDEILIGQIVDTNSAWISSHLNGMGVRVAEILSVGDERGEILRALDTALGRADVTIITGGLGPTKDDITKAALAAYFGCGMREDAATTEALGRMMKARGFDFNELNRAQAMVPECCTVLPNRNGTAPGMWFERHGRVVVSLPGVPFEMEKLMEEQVMPRLKQRFDLHPIVHRTMITAGIPESALALRIAAWEEALPPQLHLAYMPGTSGVRLRLSSYDAGQADPAAMIGEQFALLEKIISGHVIGYEGATVESAVADLLSSQGKTLAAAESCTGGVIASMFTGMPGASDYFLCGVVSYSNRSKIEVLGVDPGALAQHGAVSREVAEQMAEGVRRISGADYAVSTTGVAGPGGGSAEKPVGTVWMAVAGPRGTVSCRKVFGQLRRQNMERASATVIDMLRTMILENR